MKKYFLSWMWLLVMGGGVQAQVALPLSFREKQELKTNSWVSETPFERVQVKAAGSRVVALCVNQKNSAEFVISPEDGGIWHTKNGGVTFAPLCTTMPTMQVRALAVDWQRGVLAIVTPYGLFVSADWGATTEFRGAVPAERSSGIYLNVNNPQEMLLTAMGNLYKGDDKRGIFKTTDGGRTWQQKLALSTRTGVSGLVASEDGAVLLATAWECNNSEWESVPFGSNSAIYKSTDGGDTWNKISGNGFLEGNRIGKIGVALFDKNTYYAVVDNRTIKKANNTDNELQKAYKIHLSANDFEGMSKTDFLALDNQRLEFFLANIGENHKYKAQQLKDMIAAEVTSPSRLLNYLQLNSKEVGGAEVYVTKDGGLHWEKTHSLPLNDTYYQDGEFFGGIAVEDSNKDHLFIGGYPLLESVDGGATWRSKQPVSLEKRYEGIYMQGGTLFCNTNNGLLVSYDNGKSFEPKNVPQAVQIANLDNSLTPKEDWGNLFYGENKAPLRFGNRIPLAISVQNKDIMFAGSNKLHLSIDRGKNWRTISDDLTNGGKQGNRPYGTISAIAVSPFMFGLLYTGSDDGMIYTTDNGGVTWRKIYNAFPRALRVNHLIASRHQRNRVIATLIATDKTVADPFVFMSNDNGKSWTDIRSNLPEGRVNVVKEDPINGQILYVGTDNGLYISFNLGESWQAFSKGLPETGIRDIYINENTGEMQVATLGSGVYSTSIKMMQELRIAITSQEFYPLEAPTTIAYSAQWGNAANEWETPVKPQVYLLGFASEAGKEIPIKIIKGRVTLQEWVYKTNKGFNYIPYNLTISEAGKTAYEKSVQRIFLRTATDGNIYLPKGRYTVVFTLPDGFDEERSLEVN